MYSRGVARNFSTSFCRRKDANTRYILPMFPYPSGRLHMGHMRVYSISDALAQYYRLNGFRVLHPIGWDSFGLPAENAARSMGVQPDTWTAQNIQVMREQLKRTGCNFDWDREISTCQSEYYKWTQWIFVKLFENDLVHKRFSSVFWDPVDETVLAAEQVDADGCSWRSGAVVETKKLSQWAVETPKYAKRLADGLELIKEDWSEVAAIQANWIGRCDVFRFMLQVNEEDGKPKGEVLDLRLIDPIELELAEFIVLQSDHPLADKEQNYRYVSPKTVINFMNGRPLPIVFLAPNEHERHQEEYFLKARVGFAAKSLFDRSLARLLSPSSSAPQRVSSSPDQVLKKAEQLKLGGYQTSRVLQDWVVSRQRGWGTPIPIVIDAQNEENCRVVPVNLLPVLPEQRGQVMPDNGRIESDTLDTFFDSSWYYLRYLDPKNNQALADLSKINEYMPVDVYVGGIEHADVHLFFARFMSYFLYDIGATTVLEPFQRLLPQGFVRGQTFIELGSGRYIPKSDVEQVEEGEWKSKSSGKPLDMVYEKMSKSKANGVDPSEVIDKYGVDLTRLQLLAAAAPRSNLDWSETGLGKWIERMEWVVETYAEQRRGWSSVGGLQMVSTKRESYYRENYNYFVRIVSFCLEVTNSHSTAIARLHGLTNVLRKMEVEEAGRSIELERCVYALVIMLQIFAPNTAQAFWEELQTANPINPEVRGGSNKLSDQKWPQVDHDAEIEFIISMLDTYCNRIMVPREIIETLDDKQLIEAARNEHHRAFFKLLADRAVNVLKTKVNRRPGFYIDLNIDVPESFTRDHLKKLLDELSAEKVKTRKEAKRQRREASQAVA